MALFDDLITIGLDANRTVSGVEIVYHRGDEALTFAAIRGQHIEQAVDGQTVVAEAERFDWLFPLSELSDWTPAEPARADWIEFNGQVWEVTEQPGIGWWKHMDPAHTWCRVRVTQTAAVPVFVSQCRRRIECRADWVLPYAYTGVSPINSEETEEVWTITRLQQAGDGSVTTWTATGVKWTDRLTVTYV